jgi:predicted permease
MFTVADALLLRQLPVRDQDHIVIVAGAKRDGSMANYPLDLSAAREFGTRTRALSAVAGVGYEGAWPKPIRDGDQITRLRRAMVSGDFFGVLGVTPVLGRTLRASDDVTGAAPMAVISYSLWRQRFGGARDVIGQRLVTYDDGVSYTIAGVLPQGFDFPRGAEFWAPIAASLPASTLQYVSVNLVGRLAPGARLIDVQQEMNAFFSRPDASQWEHALVGAAQPFSQLILGNVRPAVVTFALASGLLLLITVINIANLLFVRGLARVREIAVRAALGAGRVAIIAGLVVENFLIAVAGGLLGVLLAMGAVRAFVALSPPELPRLDEIHLNGAAILAAIAITGVATLLVALAPAVLTSRTELASVLRSDARQSPGRIYRQLTEGIVIVQVALAVIVLSAAGLVTRSLIKLERADLSFDPSRLLIAELSVRLDKFADARQQAALLERLTQAVSTVPGVRAASPVVAPPFAATGGWDITLTAEGQTSADTKTAPLLNMEVVTPSYFETVGLPLIAGRAFTDADRKEAPGVIVVSQSTARHYWPGKSAIGQRLYAGSGMTRELTVVGVVADTRYRDLRVARPSVYLPLAQSFFPFAPLNLVVRTNVPPATVVASLRRAIADVDGGVALASATPFPAFLDRSLAQPRLNSLLLSVFAGAAMVLATVGLFGVIATMVRQRTHELSIRIALGATPRDLIRLVTLRGMTLTVGGLLLGTVAALFVNRSLRGLLYEVTPTDPVTLIVVAGLLLAAAALASFIPAYASTRIDASLALRSER